MSRRRGSNRRERVSLGLMAAFFASAGTLHFVKPQPYEAIMPPQLPLQRELVYISGVAELVGGLGLLSARLRPWAGLWLIGLLVAVFPANVNHAVSADEITGDKVPAWVLYARLPLQGLLIAWVWKATDPQLIRVRRRRMGRTRESLRRRRR